MAFGDSITDLGTQQAPNNSGGTCNLAITIPANSCCIVFGLVVQSTFGTTNADISDTETLTWTPLKDGTDKLFAEGSDTLGKGIFAWITNNETGSGISTTVSLTRGSPGTNAAGRSFALSAMSFSGVGGSSTNYGISTSLTGDPNPTLPSSITSGNVAVAVYLSVGNSTIISTPTDLPRVSLFATLNAPPELRQSDCRAVVSWAETEAAWSTNDQGAVALVCEIPEVTSGTTILITSGNITYSGASLNINEKTSISTSTASINYSGQGLTLISEEILPVQSSQIFYSGQYINLAGSSPSQPLASFNGLTYTLGLRL